MDLESLRGLAKLLKVQRGSLEAFQKGSLESFASRTSSAAQETLDPGLAIALS